MNFFLTKYIYPISDSIPISKKLGIYFDNPRNDAEIEYIARYIKVSLSSPNIMYKYSYYGRIPIKSNSGYLNIKSSFREFRKQFSKEDNYIKQFYRDNSVKDVYRFLAKMWIIARYDDNGAFDRLTQQGEEIAKSGEPAFFMLSDNHDIYKYSEQMVNFMYLISNLIQEDNSDISKKISLLLHTKINQLDFPKIDVHLNYCITRWCYNAYTDIPHSDRENWTDYLYIKDKLLKYAESIDKITDNKSKEILLYVGSLLRIAGDKIEDDKIRLVTLVTILELLLTRNPDTSRFNIEDSISKQFKLKAGILIYLNNKSNDLKIIKKNLTDIYNQRSNIAHENIDAFEKFLDKKLKEYPEEYREVSIVSEDFINTIYSYVRAILEEYIKDQNLVEYIKEN